MPHFANGTLQLQDVTQDEACFRKNIVPHTIGTNIGLKGNGDDQ
jgi:hypothetical protein